MPIKLHVLSAYPEGPENFAARDLAEFLKQGRGGADCVWVESAEGADVVLFLEQHGDCSPLYFEVYRHLVYRRHRRKCVLYHDGDFAFPVMKGIYPSWESRGNSPPPWIIPAPYFFQTCPNPYVGEERGLGGIKWLYSFSGALNTHVCRSGFGALKTDSRACIVDTTGLNAWCLAPPERDRFHRKFADLLRDSRFVLCPRGFSPCSYRLTETMQAGRVPVVISDGYCLPDWLPWSEFSVRVRESEVTRIPELLRERESDAEQMGQRAREVWETNLSEQTKYNKLTALVCGLAAVRGPAPAPGWAMAKALAKAMLTCKGRSLIKQEVILRLG